MPLNDEEFRQNVRWVAMSLVPQAAMNSLNPVLKVGDQVAEPAMIHLGVSKNEALEMARKMFQHVGVAESISWTAIRLNLAVACASAWRLPCRWSLLPTW